MRLSRIGRDSSRRGEEFARIQKERDALIRKQKVAALFEEASKVLKEMFAKEVTLLHNCSIDPYATSVTGTIYMKVDGKLDIKALRKTDRIELQVLRGTVYKVFANQADLEKILNEPDTTPK